MRIHTCISSENGESAYRGRLILFLKRLLMNWYSDERLFCLDSSSFMRVAGRRRWSYEHSCGWQVHFRTNRHKYTHLRSWWEGGGNVNGIKHLFIGSGGTFIQKDGHGCGQGRTNRVLCTVVWSLQSARSQVRWTRREDGQGKRYCRQNGRYGQRCTSTIRSQRVRCYCGYCQRPNVEKCRRRDWEKSYALRKVESFSLRKWDWGVISFLS